MLTPSERNRYSRHLLLPEIGEAGQEKLKASSALIIGAGGLGSPAALYLAAAGVGRIGLVDFDNVDVTNLHRQVLYGTSDVGRPKLEVAAERLRDANRDITIETHQATLTSANAFEIMKPYDVILDGTDNFPTRYLVNDACVMLGKPNVYAAIFRFEGQASVFDARRGPCYRCLYPDPPPPHLVPSCAEAGVLGVLPGIVGTIQAAEALKLLTPVGEPLIGKLLLFDALSMSFRTLRIAKNPGCKVCGPNPEVRELIDYEAFCSPLRNLDITPIQLADRIKRGDALALIDVREPYEWEGGHIDGATHIPLQQLPSRLKMIPGDREIVTICRSGSRSANAQHFLLQNGFQNVKNLAGGMKAWAKDVDPKITVR